MKTCPTCSTEWPDETKFCPKDGSTLRSAGGAASLIGSIIGGNYNILKKLGEGGMGAVYLGEHVKMSRKSAIKVMTQSMANDPDAIARFNREATNAARINHPNVCAIYDFGETQDGLIYLAMEFIEGASLSGIVEKEGALNPLRAAKIIQQTGDALQAAHDLGIVHRDLKPDNIMISTGRDGADVVKVVDFGIAKAMGGEEGQKVTKTGLVVGTPEYMSPEQLSGDKLDGRSDIYSLGLVLFRMLTGTLPFQADSAQETMIKRLTDDPKKLDEVFPNANFPARLQGVLDRALTRMPSERYSSAAQFGRDVINAVQGMGGAAPAAVDHEGATQLISTQDAKTAQVVAPTRVGGAKPGAPAKTAVSTPPTPMPHPSAAPAKKSPVALIAVVVGVLVVGGGAAAVVLSKSGGSRGGTQAAVPPTVSPGTASQTTQGNNSAGTSSPSGNTPQAVTRQPPPGGGKTGGAQNTGTQTQLAVSKAGISVDSVGLSKELDALFDQVVEASTRPRARQRAQEIYDNGAAPVLIRADAAATVAQAFQEDANTPSACTWIKRARTLLPTKDTYAKVQQTLGCNG